MRRNSNKKLLIVTWWKPILGIVLFLSVVFAPVVVGVYTDSVIKRNLQVLIGNNSTIKLVSYTRSFFHSTAIISFNGSKSSLRATLTIDHGPYLFIYNDNITDKPYIGLAKGSYTLVATPATQKHLMKYFGRQKLVTGDFTIDFDGNIINKYKTAAMHYNNKSQNVIINWPGLSGEMTITKNTKQISNRVTISGVAVSAEHNHIAISNSMLFSTATLGPMNFWLDNITFSLGSVVASARDQDYINLKQLTFNTTTVAANATQLRYADEFSIKKLVVFGQNYAPVSSVTSVKPINIAVLQKLITLINNPKNDSPIKVIRLITEGVLLVDNGSKISKTLTVNTPSGVVSANIDVYEQPGNLANDILTRLRGTLNISMPESVLKSLVAMVFSNSTTKVKQFKQDHAGSVIGLTPEVQADNFLHSQVAQGYIILDNNRYIMNFTMQDNEIRLNGKAITIDFLLAD